MFAFQAGVLLEEQERHAPEVYAVAKKGYAAMEKSERVVGDNDAHFVHENESFFVPRSTPHIPDNPGRVPLEIVEVQMGEYVSGDDIVRFDERCPEDESELISGKSGQTFNRLRQKHQRPFERTGACFWKRDPSQARETISSTEMKPVPVKVTPGILFRT